MQAICSKASDICSAGDEVLYCDMEGTNRVFLRTRAAGRSKA